MISKKDKKLVKKMCSDTIEFAADYCAKSDLRFTVEPIAAINNSTGKVFFGCFFEIEGKENNGKGLEDLINWDIYKVKED